MMRLMIKPLICENGIRYTVSRRRWLFFREYVQFALFYDDSINPNSPFDTFMGNSHPYWFVSIKEASKWIRKQYGKSADIEVWMP